MRKSPRRCENEGLRKGPWTPAEDQKLQAFIQDYGHGNWRVLPAKAGLQRCGKSCRLRWTNYLRPDIKRGKFSLQEERTIINLHALLGNRWSTIATNLPKRTDNEIKNYWNTHLKKRLTKMGIDPATHTRKHNHSFAPSSANAKDATNLIHMAQWENARLEAEARLVRESTHLVNITTSNQPKGFMNKSAMSTQPSHDVLKAGQGVRSSKPTIQNKSYTKNGWGINMMSMAMKKLESPTSIQDISELMYNTSYPMHPIHAKELPQLDDTNGLLQEVDAYNDYKDGSTNTLYVWLSEDVSMIEASSGISDVNNVNLPGASVAMNSNVMDGFHSTEDMLLYTPEEQNMVGGIMLDCVGDVDGGRGHSDNIENQNRSYWNNIMNELVNASPPYGGRPSFYS